MKVFPFRLTAPCKDYIWGGNRLREYGKVSEQDRIAESWELSCHPDGESIIAEGEGRGMTLTAFLKLHPEILGSRTADPGHFPLLVKLIDAREDLSLQVHPDDAYARRVEGASGKTEMWYIVEADPGAELICGFEKEITRAEFRRSIEENTIMDKVRHIPVKKGDVCFIPAGTLHAIGKGLLIAEIQQNSNITYRVYDHGRLGKDGKPRELHIEKALDVTDLHPAKPYKMPENPFPAEGVSCAEPLILSSAFAVFRKKIRGKGEVRAFPYSFSHLLVIAGEGKLSGSEGELPLKKGTSVFVPAGRDTFLIQGECTLIETTLL